MDDFILKVIIGANNRLKTEEIQEEIKKKYGRFIHNRTN